jgi:serine protein kinase
MAAMWAVLTRLEEPKKANLTLLQKLKLYNGQNAARLHEDNVKELREEAPREGMEGISPRYIQDKISNTLVSEQKEGTISPFMVLNELESGSTSLADQRARRQASATRLARCRARRVRGSSRVKFSARSRPTRRRSRSAQLHRQRQSLYAAREGQEQVHRQDEEPDERLMRSIEEKIDIPESRKDDFRREIMNYIGALAIEGKKFDYRTNERLHKALELKLFEDQKDSIKLTNARLDVVDNDTQEKIDVVKQRLIKQFGYNEQSATDVLNYVASIFARGDAKAMRADRLTDAPGCTTTAPAPPRRSASSIMRRRSSLSPMPGVKPGHTSGSYDAISPRRASPSTGISAPGSSSRKPATSYAAMAASATTWPCPPPPRITMR